MSIFRIVKHSHEIQTYQTEYINNSLIYLKSLNVSNIKLGLDRITRICSILNNPQNEYYSILVGGTNGKGSVCAFLSSILQEAKFKTGLYTSPHLIKPEERIQINRVNIDSFDLAKFIIEHKKIDKEFNIGLTYFEFMTSIAFQYFKESKIDIGIFEVGLGGTYDATNVVSPLISCVTHIDYDHLNVLGNSLFKIAKEKAGIIKENGCFIHMESRYYIKKLFKDICKEKNSIYIDALKGCKFDIKFKYPYYHMSLITPYNKYKSIKIPFIGYYQVFNAILAIRLVEELRLFNIDISPEIITKGIVKTKWQGRLEIVKDNPLVILDCAHNPEGIKAALYSIKSIKKNKLIIIFGVLQDKLWEKMLKEIDMEADYIILTKPNSDRALELSNFLKVKLATSFDIEGNPEIAMEKALSKASSNDLIVVLGSTYLVGQIKNVLDKNK